MSQSSVHSHCPLQTASVWLACLGAGLAITLLARQLPAEASASRPLFAFVVVVAYGLLYFMPVVFVCRLLPRSWQCASLKTPGVWVVAAICTFIVLILFANSQLYQRYGFHINGFVLNIVFTPGGIDSLGMTESTSSTGVIAVTLSLSLIVALVYRLTSVVQPSHLTTKLARPLNYALLTFFLWGVQGTCYGYYAFYSVGEAYAIAEAVPAFQPVTYRKVLRKLGYHQPELVSANTAALKQHGKLHYPRYALQVELLATPPNIVWMVAESWRADSLTPEIMPHTSAFSEKALRFNQHYSGGNGTRMGMFSMFYGLYGSYWFDFLEQQREPVLFNLLRQANYQMSMYTSAKFSYPEFDKTIFSNVPENTLHEDNEGLGWERDQHNVGRLLDFIRKRDPERPFMTFMFFESPHASYYFPEDAVIEPGYLKDFNYLTTDVPANIQGIKKRYVNAVHHLDKQFERIYQLLESEQLMENTIVIVTGDHGEEFMENGYWGHNSTFSQQQIRVPLLLHYPGGTTGSVSRTTNHVDIIPTLLPMLGVKSPSIDYSLGINLLSDRLHDFMVVADWDSVAIITPEFKKDIPLKVQGMIAPTPVTSLNDLPLTKLNRDAHYKELLMAAFERVNHFYQ